MRRTKLLMFILQMFFWSHVFANEIEITNMAKQKITISYQIAYLNFKGQSVLKKKAQTILCPHSSFSIEMTSHPNLGLVIIKAKSRFTHSWRYLSAGCWATTSAKKKYASIILNIQKSRINCEVSNSVGRHDWYRTNDPHHVKVVL